MTPADPQGFNLAVEAHKRPAAQERGTLLHPHHRRGADLKAEETGLGATGVVAALLHDTVEDTLTTLDDIRDSSSAPPSPPSSTAHQHRRHAVPDGQPAGRELPQGAATPERGTSGRSSTRWPTGCTTCAR